MKGQPMEIRWRNIIALALLIFALLVLLKAYRQITAFLSTMTAVGPGSDSKELTFGLMAFGLMIIAVVAVVRILKDN